LGALAAINTRLSAMISSTRANDQQSRRHAKSAGIRCLLQTQSCRNP